MNPQTAVALLLSGIASLAAALATLGFLAGLLSSGFFADRPPQGANAMGIMVILLFVLIAALLLLVAHACLLAGGRLDGLIAGTGWASMAVSLLLGIAAVGALLLWVDCPAARGWIVPVGVYAGGIAPLLACLLALVAAWSGPDCFRGAGWLPLLHGALLLGAAGGLWMLLFGLFGPGRH